MDESDHNVTFLELQEILMRFSALDTMLAISAKRSAPQSSSRGIVLAFNGATLDLEQYN